jgi:hypothetical protein
VGLFETIDMLRVAMAMQVKEFLSLYNLLDKLIGCVKDEGGNLSTLAWALISVVSCGLLAFVVLWHGSCFDHVYTKTCQYACNDTNVYVGFREVSLKAIQSTLQKTITWIKKFGKGRSEWQRACLDARVSHQKLKTPMKTRFISKVILFQETLEY